MKAGLGRATPSRLPGRGPPRVLAGTVRCCGRRWDTRERGRSLRGSKRGESGHQQSQCHSSQHPPPFLPARDHSSQADRSSHRAYFQQLRARTAPLAGRCTYLEVPRSRTGAASFGPVRASTTLGQILITRHFPTEVGPGFRPAPEREGPLAGASPGTTSWGMTFFGECTPHETVQSQPRPFMALGRAL